MPGVYVLSLLYMAVVVKSNRTHCDILLCGMFVFFSLLDKNKRQCKTNERMLQDGAEALPENLIMVPELRKMR